MVKKVNYPVAELRGIKNNYSTLCYGDQGVSRTSSACARTLCTRVLVHALLA